MAILLLLQTIGSSNALSFATTHSNSAANTPNSLPLADFVPPNGQTNIVSLSIIIDEASNFDQLATWLRALNFRNFTFVVVEGTTNEYILKNATRIDVLEHYGRIIPRLSHMQSYEPTNRIWNVNFTLNELANALGYTPKGAMDFMPDTYTARYLLTRGV